MRDLESEEGQALEQLRAENESLKDEIYSLRQFIDALQNLVESVEQPPGEAEIMDVLSQVLENAMQVINAKDGSLLVLDEDTGELVFVIAAGDVPSERLAWRRLPAGTGIAGWVAQHAAATIVNDVQTDNRFYEGVDEELAFETNSILAAPIVGGSRVLGVVEMLNKKNGMGFSVDDQTLLALVCRFAGELLTTAIAEGAEGLPSKLE